MSKPPKARKDAQSARDDADAAKQIKEARPADRPRQERRRQEEMTTHDLVLPPTEGEHHGAGDGVVDVGSGRVEPVGVSASTATEKPSPAPPFTAAEWDEIQSTVWSDLAGDPYRISDLLSIALGTLGGIALDAQTDAAALCVRTLREMEQRALWGPVHGDQEDHR